MFPGPGHVVAFDPDYPRTPVLVGFILPEWLYVTPENTDVARFQVVRSFHPTREKKYDVSKLNMDLKCYYTHNWVVILRSV